MELLGYLIKANVLLLLFFAIYKVLLERETFFRTNRIYLLSTTIVALVAPLLRWNSVTISSESYEHWMTVLPEVWVGQATSSAPEPVRAWVWFYVVCASGMASRFVYLLLTAWRASRQPDSDAAFTFLGIVFVAPYIQGVSRHTILEHEEVHCREGHSIDVLFFEIVHCLFWFNPLMGVLKRSVRLNHEFLADAQALHSTDAESYALLLLSQTLHTNEPLLVHSFFSQSLLKSRITMIYTQPSAPRKMWKYLAVIPAFALVIAAQTNVLAQSSPTKATPTKEVLPPPAPPAPPAPPKAPNEAKEIVQADQPAEYPGGQEALMKYLGSQLSYPKGETAEGKVFVSFVVQSDGKIADVKIKKSAAPALDKEAMRVVSGMPKWTPAKLAGKPVAAEMVLPISFKMTDEGKTAPLKEK